MAISSPSASLSSLELIRPSEMDASLVARWLEFTARKPHLGSPYYHPEFSRLVDTLREDVRVAIIREAGEVIGFFPFQTGKDKVGYPVGGWLNDFHGPIGKLGIYANVRELLRACELNEFNFHGLDNIEAFPRVQPFQTLDCPYIDLSEGFSAYQKHIEQRSRTIRKQPQKTRKMIRELGPLRFELDSADESVLEYVFKLKQHKFQSTGAFDIFSIDWTEPLLREIFESRSADFQGMLSAMWAGDTLVAAHFGFANNQILHYWFPVYGPEFHRYSAGTQLLLNVCEGVAERGIHTIDLGYGQHPFKHKFTDKCKYVSRGVLKPGVLGNFTARHVFHFKNWIKTSRMGGVARLIVRKLHPGFGKQGFR